MTDLVERLGRTRNALYAEAPKEVADAIAETIDEAIAALTAAPVSVGDELRQCVKEIIEWRATGKLSGSALRKRAYEINAPEHLVLRLAEDEVTQQALEHLASCGTTTPPPPQEPSDVSKWRDAAFTTAANIVTAHFGKDGKACCDDILALRRAKGE